MTLPSESPLQIVADELEESSTSTPVRHSEIADLSGMSRLLPSPAELRLRHSLSSEARTLIAKARHALRCRIETGSGAPVVVLGPCSIHCETAALEYAKRLRATQKKLGDRVQLIMRVYFEKPRTTVGWKGFLYDPDLDGSDNLSRGLDRARALMVTIAEMGIPMATEILDPLMAPYLEDCVSWVAVGARTTESQIHRQMASSLACPVGFKNGTDGSVTTAIQASQASEEAHTYLGIDEQGHIALRRSRGNSATHLVLRGGRSGPNFDRESVASAGESLRHVGRRPAVMVDCSHGNSNKDYRRQPEVFRAVMAQLGCEHADVFGLMIESHLQAGKQSVEEPRDYGVSVTDGCIDFATTEALLMELAEMQ